MEYGVILEYSRVETSAPIAVGFEANY